jgi:hydrogenase expression/formation protein HypE
MTCLPTGKLSPDLLADLLRRHVQPDPRVVAGPGIGIDAAILDLGDRRCLVAKTDPITYATERIGWYAVYVNANDVACCGAVPRWFLVTVLLPEGKTTEQTAESIFSQISQACRQLEVAWCGGHTEVVAGLARPIVVGQMLGEVAGDDWLTAAQSQAGDTLILTKGIAIEGTALIAREKREELRGVLPAADLERCAELLDTPGISVVRDARLALEVGGVHALHDPTEGGVAGGLWELAQASGLGVVVHEQQLAILPECAALCRHYELDPLGLIASGALLIAAQADRAGAIIERLRADGIAAAEIGRLVPAEQGYTLQAADRPARPLPIFARDEITRLFE